MGGELDRAGTEKALLWVLNLSDGEHSLFDIAERTAWHLPSCGGPRSCCRQHQLIRECAANGLRSMGDPGGKEPVNAKG